MSFVLVIAFSVSSATKHRSDQQVQDPPSNLSVYDVVSIKPAAVSGADVVPGIRYTPDGMTAKAVSVRALIRRAYGIQRFQISGEPKWFDTETYDVDAKMDGALASEIEKLGPEKSQVLRQEMLRALLADRFRLIMHRDTKELPIYFLVISKNGPKLVAAVPGFIGPSDIDGPDGIRATNSVTITRSGTVIGQAASIATLANSLSVQLGRPVNDRTGLTGQYDFTFKFVRDDIRPSVPSEGVTEGQLSPLAADPNGPTLSGAIQEHLGLKLESGKGPVEIIVIDHVERASGN